MKNKKDNKKKDKKKTSDESTDEKITLENQETQDSAKLDPIDQKIKELEESNASLVAELQKLKADYANYQKRVPRQIQEAVGYKIEAFVKTLLPGIDNFEHALKTDDSHSVEDVLKGIQIVYDNFLEILKSNGVEQIKSTGEKFDPAQHSAMLQQADENKQDGIILEEYMSGYKFNDKVIRPSMVVVNKLDAQAKQETQEEAESDDQ